MWHLHFRCFVVNIVHLSYVMECISFSISSDAVLCDIRRSQNDVDIFNENIAFLTSEMTLVAGNMERNVENFSSSDDKIFAFTWNSYFSSEKMKTCNFCYWKAKFTEGMFLQICNKMNSSAFFYFMIDSRLFFEFINNFPGNIGWRGHHERVILFITLVF